MQKKTSNEWFVYLLDCDGSHLYTGTTNNVSKRVNDHRSGKAPGAKFTRRFKHIELAYSVKCASKRQAYQIEYALKRKKREAKLNLIKLQLNLKQLQASLLL